ncbi:MAG: hypothetical protein PHO37_16620 [Kiritimatiellae bacterium]|nr:hypothetical protein [Kiritimatiellia bacterium]
MLSNYKHLYLVTLLTLAGMTLSFTPGCKPSEQKQAEQHAEIEQRLEATFSQIYQLQSEQKYAEADALITKSLSSRDFADFKDRLTLLKTELLIQQAKYAEAEEVILGELARSPTLVNDSLNALFAHYAATQSFDKSLALSGKILDAHPTLPDAMLASILSGRLGVTLEMDDIDLQKSALDAIISAVKESSKAVAMIEPQIATLLQKKNYPAVMELVAHIRKAGAGDEHYANFAATINLKCVVESQNWEQLNTAYESCVQQMPDNELTKLMRYVFVALSKARKAELIKQCALSGIYNATGKPRSTDYAASKWVEICFAEDKKTLPVNLAALKKTAVSPDQIASIFDRYFYEVATDSAVIKELCRMGAELVAACSDENIQNSLKVKILDGAFIIEDYDLAVSLLEAGIPGKDQAWHEMSLPKVKAHRAQARKQPREAVKHYREFMDCWKTSEKEEELDPTSGIAYSKEWILARNASRIAEILSSIPDEAEAALARDEAKAYFKVAIEKAQEDAAALKLVTEEAAKLK